MTLSKGAVGNLINRYRAVLKKCHLMNVFGSLAVAGMLVLGGAGVAGAWSNGTVDDKSFSYDGYYLITGLADDKVDFTNDVATVTSPLQIESANLGIQARVDKKSDADIPRYPQINVNADTTISAGNSAVSGQDGIVNIGNKDNYVSEITLHSRATKLDKTDPTSLSSVIYARNLFGKGEVNLYGKNVSITTEKQALKEGSGDWGCAISGNGNGVINIHGKDTVLIRGAIESLNEYMSKGASGIKININQDAADTAKVDMEGIYINAADKSEVNIKGADGSRVASKLIATASDKVSGGKINIALAGDTSSYSGVIDAKNKGEISVKAGKITSAGGATGPAISVDDATVALEGKNISLTASSSSGVSKTVEALNGADISFAGAQTSIRNDSTTTAKNYGVYLKGAKATFAADSTNIAVKGIGSSDNWGYGVDLWSGATASFTGGAVSISDYQRDYTAQTLTVRDTSSLVFQNSGNVDIKAESPYGATAIVVKDGDTAKMTFKNAGNVTITSAIENPTTTLSRTNVVGLMVEKGTAEFTPDVAKVDFVISGQGCDFKGDDSFDGTIAAFVRDKDGAGAKLDVQAKELNINVSAAVDPSVKAPDSGKYDDAYGIRVYGGTASVGAATKTAINVNESRGTAYGVAAERKYSTIEILGDASINAKGNTNAYALYANDSGSITFGSNGNSGSLTSSGTAVFIGKDSSVALNGNTTITAAKALEGEGKVTNAGALTIAGGTVSGFTGTFEQTAGTTAIGVADFGGTVTINGGALNVAQKLDLSNGSVTVNTSGSVNVAAGGTITFGGKSLTISGGSVTADASNFITKDFNAVTGASDGIKGTSGNLNILFNGGTYTADNYNTAKSALFGQGENATLSFLGATLELKTETEEKLVVKGTVNDNKATISTTTPVVTDNNGGTADVGIASVPEQHVAVVDSNSGDMKSVGEIEIKDSTFTTKGLQIASLPQTATNVTLNVTSDQADKTSAITLIGGDRLGSSVVVDESGKAVKTEITVAKDSALTFGMKGNVNKQMATVDKLDVKGGTVNVDGNNIDDTRYHYDTLNVSTPGNGDNTAPNVNLSHATVSANTAKLEAGTVQVLHSAAHIEELDATGGTLFVDPAYVKVSNLKSSTFGSKLLVGSGSVVELGSIADLQAKAAEAGMSTAMFGNGFTVGSGESMLALGKAVTLGSNGKIVVAAGVDNEGKIGGTDVSDAAHFGDKSLLVVDSAIASGDGAIKANSSTNDTITVKQGAKLYLVDAKANGEYVIASNFKSDSSSSVEGWTGGDLLTNRLIAAERTFDNGAVKVKTTAKQAAATLPGISIPNILDRMTGDKLNGVDSGNAGVRFLSRALEPAFLAEGDVVPTLDGAAQLAYAGGVQASTVAVAQAPVRAIQSHLSLAGNVAQKGTSLHENGFDLWANAIYGANRARDFSAGSLDAGYDSDFAGGVIGGDWTFDAGAGKGRVGLALNVGAGDTKSRGDFNSTKNDFDFWGVSLYGGWNMDNVNVVADLGYSASKNELKQDIPSSLGLGGRIKGDVDSSVITAGVKAEYMVKTDVLDVMPHVGVRYMAVKTDSFTTKLDMGGDLFRTDGDLQHVWQFPVGVNLSKSFETESGWKVKPQADLSVVPAAGDTKAKIDVRTPGVNASDSMKRRVMDTTSFDGVFGVEMQKDNVSFGLSYNVQASEHQTGQGVTASFMYKF